MHIRSRFVYIFVSYRKSTSIVHNSYHILFETSSLAITHLASSPHIVYLDHPRVCLVGMNYPDFFFTIAAAAATQASHDTNESTEHRDYHEGDSPKSKEGVTIGLECRYRGCTDGVCTRVTHASFESNKYLGTGAGNLISRFEEGRGVELNLLSEETSLKIKNANGDARDNRTELILRSLERR